MLAAHYPKPGDRWLEFEKERLPSFFRFVNFLVILSGSSILCSLSDGLAFASYRIFPPPEPQPFSSAEEASSEQGMQSNKSIASIAGDDENSNDGEDDDDNEGGGSSDPTPRQNGDGTDLESQGRNGTKKKTLANFEDIMCQVSTLYLNGAVQSFETTSQ